METKQHTTEKPMGHPRNQRKNLKKIPRDSWKWKHSTPKSKGCSKSSSKKEVHGNVGLPQETRRISNNLIFIAKETKKRANETHH